MSSVYIIPLVRVDPPERVTAQPLQKADKAYLMERTIDAASPYYRSLKYELERSYDMEVKTVYVNNNDLLSYLEKFREIFNAEQGHDRFVNLSTGNKITAVAGMIACMLWNGIPYYVRLGPKKATKSHPGNMPPIEYHPIYGIDYLPVFETAKPSADSMKVLSMINEAGGDISKKSLIERLQSSAYRMIPQYPPSATKSAPHSRLHAILDPLEKHWRCITIQARGRWSKVSLTEMGKEALRISVSEKTIDRYGSISCRRSGSIYFDKLSR